MSTTKKYYWWVKQAGRKNMQIQFNCRKESRAVVKCPLEGAFYQKYKTTEPDLHAVTSDCRYSPCRWQGHIHSTFHALFQCRMPNLDYLELVQLRLTAWMFKVGSGQAWYLKVVHRRHWTLGGTPAVPLVESVPGLWAQHPGCLLFLEVLDEGHCSIGTGQVVAPWKVNQGKMAEAWMETREKKPDRTMETHQGQLSRNETSWQCTESVVKSCQNISNTSSFVIKINLNHA